MSDTINLANSIWPNGMIVDSDGYAVFNDLGTDKIPVPTNTSDWPEGDELISPFVYKNEKLVGFVDTKAMTVDSPTAITLDYNRIEADFSSIEEGMLTITAPNATDVKYTWANSSSSDTGNSGDTVVLGTKYLGCKTVNDVIGIEPNFKTVDIIDGSWTQSLADLEDGNSMFYGCIALETFESDLSSLTNSVDMFHLCTSLTSFNADMSNLTDGSYMFCECYQLTSFSSDLSNLTNGSYMFERNALTSFSSDLSSLTDGHGMFYSCSNLTSFSSNLSSLTNGSYMFNYCKLDTASVQNIADTINTPTSKGTIHIGIGNTSPNEQEKTAFNTIASRNWTVYVGVNGSYGQQWTPTATTPIDGEQTTAPIPFYAKPVQSDEEHAHYVDEQGNYYNILGGNFIYGDSLETYGMFTCEADAAANMRLTKIERN